MKKSADLSYSTVPTLAWLLAVTWLVPQSAGAHCIQKVGQNYSCFINGERDHDRNDGLVTITHDLKKTCDIHDFGISQIEVPSNGYVEETFWNQDKIILKLSKTTPKEEWKVTLKLTLHCWHTILPRISAIDVTLQPMTTNLITETTTVEDDQPLKLLCAVNSTVPDTEVANINFTFYGPYNRRILTKPNQILLKVVNQHENELTILNAHPSDSGYYYCQAQIDQLIMRSGTISVTVLGTNSCNMTDIQKDIVIAHQKFVTGFIVVLTMLAVVMLVLTSAAVVYVYIKVKLRRQQAGEYTLNINEDVDEDGNGEEEIQRTQHPPRSQPLPIRSAVITYGALKNDQASRSADGTSSTASTPKGA